MITDLIDLLFVVFIVTMVSVSCIKYEQRIQKEIQYSLQQRKH